MNAGSPARNATIAVSTLCPRCGARTARSHQPMPLHLVSRSYAAQGEARRCTLCGWTGVRISRPA